MTDSYDDGKCGQDRKDRGMVHGAVEMLHVLQKAMKTICTRP